MHRFYCPNTDFSPPRITLSNPAEIHHLKNVLRMSSGDHLALFNGQGEEVIGEIETMNAMQVQVFITQRQVKKQSAVSIVLACAVPKKAKFETIIEKCTELGVDEIIPMRTARTEVILKEEKQDRKNLRFQSVAVNAAKQSARATIPIVHPQSSFKSVIALFDAQSLRLIPSLIGERKRIKDVVEAAKSATKVVILIGPEGDFTHQEQQAAITAGFIPVSLGETTLKVDTAAITAIGFVRLMLE